MISGDHLGREYTQRIYEDSGMDPKALQHSAIGKTKR